MSKDTSSWRASALCRVEGHDPELFFPIGSTGPAALRQIAEAKAVCDRCPVIAQCRAEAEEKAGTCGVWGGTSEDDRLNNRRRAKRLART